MLRKIFRVFNFHQKARRRKVFNDENFVIYSIIVMQLVDMLGMGVLPM